MAKQFNRSDNYYVAETLNGEPEVWIDNYIDDDGGFKLWTRVDFGDRILVTHRTVARSLTQSGEKVDCPDCEIEELIFAEGKVRRYKGVLEEEEDIDEELRSQYSDRFGEQAVGTA